MYNGISGMIQSLLYVFFCYKQLYRNYYLVKMAYLEKELLFVNNVVSMSEVIFIETEN